MPAEPILLASRVESIGTWPLWTITLAALLALLVADFVVTRKPHQVSMREALGWSTFYLLLPIAFGGFIWANYGGTPAVEFFTGFVVEKSLSVDNLFVFMLLLAAFAVPAELAQRVLLYGIVGALVLRGIFIALGAAMLKSGAWAFLLFGAILIFTAIKILREMATGSHFQVDIDHMRSVRALRKFMPVTKEWHGPQMTVLEKGTRVLTPFAVVVVAVFAADIVFAVDSVPAVYGVTGDPYLVFTTNAFALLGLRALYFVLQGALGKLRYLNHGLAIILAFIGVKLVLHWAHDNWPGVPQIPTTLSLAAIALILATVTATSLLATRAGQATDGRHEPDAHRARTLERTGQGRGS
jgi:TerC family integral membrane protein